MESKEAQNDFVKEEIVSIKKDMKETRGDILLIKEYLSKQENKKVRGKRCSNFDELKELKGLKHHRLYKN